MNIKILTVGKLGKGYIKEGVDDYSKRLSKYTKIAIIEVGDEKTAENMSLKELSLIKQKEGCRIFAHIKENSFVCALDIKGTEQTTEQFAAFIEKRKMDRVKDIIYIIGGSVGLSDSILKRADFVISFSKLTFPHGLMRLILLEQLYRAEKILHGEPYHK